MGREKFNRVISLARPISVVFADGKQLAFLDQCKSSYDRLTKVT